MNPTPLLDQLIREIEQDDEAIERLKLALGVADYLRRENIVECFLDELQQADNKMPRIPKQLTIHLVAEAFLKGLEAEPLRRQELFSFRSAPQQDDDLTQSLCESQPPLQTVRMRSSLLSSEKESSTSAPG